MAVGKPILMALDGDAADLVRECGCGEVAISENPESLAAAALALKKRNSAELNEMEDNSRRFYREKLSLSAGVAGFSAIFTRLGNGGLPKA